MLKRITIYAPAGGNFVAAEELAYVDVITVKRNGQREYPVEALPTGTESNFYHDEGAGQILFSVDRLFNSTVLDENGFVIPEFVHVLYKERT